MNQPLERKEPAIAALLSFLFGGVGQLYCRKINRGILFILVSVILWIFASAVGDLIVLTLAFGLFAMIDAYNLAKDINAKIDFDLAEESRIEETKKVEEKQLKANLIEADSFVESAKSYHKLLETEIYTQEEYGKKIKTLISTLASKKLACEPEQFLAALIPLKEQEILSLDDVKKIKILIL